MAFSCFKACMGRDSGDGTSCKEQQLKSAEILSNKLQRVPTEALPCQPSSPQPDYKITSAPEAAETGLEVDSVQAQVVVSEQPQIGLNVSEEQTVAFPELAVVGSYVRIPQVDGGTFLDGARQVVPVSGPDSAVSESLANMSSSNTEERLMSSSSTPHSNPDWELPFRPRRIRTAVSSPDHDQSRLPPQLSINSMVGSRWSAVTDTPGVDYPLPSDDASNPFGNARNQDLGARSSFDSDVGTPRGSDCNATQFSNQNNHHVHFSDSVAVACDQSTSDINNASAQSDTPQLSPSDSAANVVLNRRFSAATNVPSRLSRASVGEFSNANTGSLSTATSNACGHRYSSSSERNSASTADRDSPQEAMNYLTVDKQLSSNMTHNSCLHQVAEESGEESQLLSTLPEHRTSEASWGTSTRSFAVSHDAADPSHVLTRSVSKSNSGGEN